MTDDNNNADFEAALPSTMRPAPPMTRGEFIARLETLVENLRNDHEEQTGVTDTELHDWEYWSTELSNAYLNSD